MLADRVTYKEAMRRARVDYVRAALRRHGSVSKAAAAAGLNRVSMYKLMTSLGITLDNGRKPHVGNREWQEMRA